MQTSTAECKDVKFVNKIRRREKSPTLPKKVTKALGH